MQKTPPKLVVETTFKLKSIYFILFYYQRENCHSGAFENMYGLFKKEIIRSRKNHPNFIINDIMVT